MREFLMKFFCALTRFLFSLRYKIEIKGLDKISRKNLNKKGGILFLPNHPANIDPVILSVFLWPKFKIHPLVVEYIYRQAGINTIMKLIGALSVPNLETSTNEIKIRKVRDVIDRIIKGLNRRKNYLLYPSGRLKHTGKEIVGGASAVHHILQKCPDINIVLIRTVGLWGSSFSRAIEGTSPDFKKTLINGFTSVLKSLIFFLPRRRVEIDLNLPSKDFPYEGTRLQINKYLENWYNKYNTSEGVKDSEPLNLVSYSAWKKVLLIPFEKQKKIIIEKEGNVSETTKSKIIQELAKIANRDPNTIKDDNSLAMDLGLDSLDVAEFISFISLNYDISEIHPEELETVDDALKIAEGLKQVKKQNEIVSTLTWPKEKERPPVMPPMGETLQEAFLNSCDRMKDCLACADDITGIMTYKELKRAAIVISNEFRDAFEGKYVGVLLPASLGAYLVIMGILLAGKIPVMLNWTLGPRYLNNMMQLTHTKAVISSWKFLEKISNVDFGHLVHKLHLMEDIKRKITPKNKIKGALTALKGTKSLLKKFKLNEISKNDPAVILFTSGTESTPKGVPLSHENILFNQQAALQCVDICSKDTMYGILPPFHSFGFSVAGFLPILSGLRIVFFPDPTDSFQLAEGIDRWKVTVFCSAPSFLKGLLSAAKKEQLKTIRLFVTGAEKTPKSLFDKIKEFGSDKKLIEGYGITECSPIISISRINEPKKGVGKLLPGIEACLINPDTHELIDQKGEGEICVRSPSVFKGYIGKQKSPFVEINNKKWYMTGDLGYIEDGSIILSGRLKRFCKIAGEMVSLGGIEEILSHEIFLNKQVGLDEDHQLAVVAKEKEDDKSKLILFTTLDIKMQDVNLILKDAGLSRLVKISEVKKVDEIPLLGTGKTDYRSLQSLLG